MLRLLTCLALVGAAGDASAALRILTDLLPPAHAGEPYSVELRADGGLPPYTWTAAPLPRGLELRDATIEGTPEVPDDHTGPTLVTLTVRDRSSNDSASWVLALPVLESRPLRVEGPGGTWCSVGHQFNMDVWVRGGVAPYTWRHWGFPAGVSCEEMSTRLFCTGWPLQPGVFTGVVLVEDASGQEATEEYPIECIGDPPAIGPAELRCAGVGLAYEEQLLSNYTGVRWSLVSGSLPPGLALESSGAIRGTVPVGTRVGQVFVFRVRATHDLAGSSERNMAIQTVPENVGCSGPDPEMPGEGGSTGQAGAGGTGGSGVPGAGGTGGRPGSGGAGGSGGTGATTPTRRAVRAQTGCDCDGAGAGGSLLAAATLASLLRRRIRR